MNFILEDANGKLQAQQALSFSLILIRERYNLILV